MTVDQVGMQMAALAKRGYGVPFHLMWTVYVKAIVRGGPRHPYPQWRVLNAEEYEARRKLQRMSDVEFLYGRVSDFPRGCE